MSSSQKVITAKADLVEYLETGSKPDRSTWRIGSEHEKFIFYRPDNSPLAYEAQGDKPGIKDVIQAFIDHGWAPYEENGYLIAAKKDGASITLEPGGQFELSGAPLETIHQTCNETSSHLKCTQEIGEKLNIGFLGLGFHPTLKREEIPVMPKARYDIMRAYMPTVGTMGLDMMLRTCTVQVNLDFASEADMIEKFRISLALQPLATALFANSPMKEGKLNGFKSLRSHVWTDTDPDRCGMLPFVFEDGMGFERWADHLLDTPMYFVRRGDKYINAAGQSFRDFMKGELPALPGELPTMEDFEDHMTTLFPEVRLKTFLEMRGADGGPWSRLCALPAFWVGLLYDREAQSAAWDLVKNWSIEEMAAMRDNAPQHGLQTEVNGRTFQDLAKEVLKISDLGLKNRARFSTSGETEQGFLKSLWDSADSGKTPADNIKDMLEGDWQGNTAKLFTELSY
ncbi:glutamate--cysteine ligase [Kordiimonas laminariae]|uniref:glutamate--cysteine ligase n=1 Tax=Kordiimonas laminariae TaxID=2917717 RepID=UPI001FF42FA0|nr:glutamate--cysteine ligase [Kordiimonas laminariae]MCK0068854.1 glutamate--cysteine ligase [Kordiimonas laminariae]